MGTQSNLSNSRAAEELSGLVIYDRFAAVSPLRPLKIEKADIPDFILCKNFEKAKAKVERALEKYDTKLNRVRSDIEAQNRIIEKAKLDKPIFVSSSSSSERVHKHNQCVSIINRANEKRNDLIDRRDDIAMERQERLEELTEEALLTIDDDIVAVLDKCNKLVDKLARSQNSDDAMTAVDVSLIALKVGSFFDDFIEDNSSRRDCKERSAQISTSMATVCGSDQLRNSLADVFRRNAFLISQNTELFRELLQTLTAPQQPEIDELKRQLDGIMGEQFQTLFEFEGVVDPNELESLIAGMERTIEAGEGNAANVQQTMQASQPAAESLSATQEAANGIYNTMKANVEGMKSHIIGPSHFTRQLLDEAVIDDFYSRELGQAVGGLRQLVAQTVGEDVLDVIVGAGEDLNNIAMGDAAIRKADLLRFQASRDKVPAHIKQIQVMVGNMREEIGRAEEVPQQNANALQSSLTVAYAVSCFPWIGIFGGAIVPQKIKKFEPAFRSSVPVYRELADTLAKRNSVMIKVMLGLAVVLGLGGIGAFFALGLTSKPELNAAVPGAAFVLYGVSAALFALAGKRLTSAIGAAPSFEQGGAQPAQQISASVAATDE